MAKYLALLRGVNVGGKNIIKMADLKSCFEQNGFTHVSTFIQSGNIIFDSSEKDISKLEALIEKIFSNKFNYKSTVLVRSKKQIEKILSGAPGNWLTKKDLRCYIAFIKKPLTSKEAAKEITLKKDIDFLKIGNGVLYMTTLLSGITKSSFSRLASKKIYQSITIRNYNTTKKLSLLMQSPSPTMI